MSGGGGEATYSAVRQYVSNAKRPHKKPDYTSVNSDDESSALSSPQSPDTGNGQPMYSPSQMRLGEPIHRVNDLWNYAALIQLPSQIDEMLHNAMWKIVIEPFVSLYHTSTLAAVRI